MAKITLQRAVELCSFAHAHGFEAYLTQQGYVRVEDEDGWSYVDSLKQLKQWLGY